ncbi:putative serine/threonine-protein kinase At1g54610 isoform X2 [Nicotiana tabacum]|uniref:Serine/threonine-protein kinase At1g54610 isoform X2 n=1 Tax=Nicotiana tabacum TaxID=4097 RepID=A0A1S4CPF9_TOBAC|nr:PREDICTED: probable serine/threonine-protein kinase At1g54610 isoform X2 [Nicotiana tabacum]
MGCVLGKIAAAKFRRGTKNSNASDGVGVPEVDAKITQPPPTAPAPSVPEYYSHRISGNSFTMNQQGWPAWLVAVAGDAIKDWTPRRANTFEKLDKIGQGTYSNVYKARDLITGKIVALKKVRFDTLEPESVKFMAREILVLKKLNHPNVIKLEGLVTSRMSSSLYLVFEYMEHDLAGLAAVQKVKFTEPQVEQLHKIFKLCGSPSDEYWKKFKLPNATLFKPQQPYKRCIADTFKDFPPSSHPLIEKLLAIDPDERGTATAALNSEFFATEPYPCEPSSLPKYPPSKEMDVKLRDEAARRQRGLHGKAQAVVDGTRKVRIRERVSRAIPAPEANAELQPNLDRWRVMTQANAKSKSEKFPPPHQDGAVGYPLDASHNGPVSFSVADASFTSSNFDPKSRSLRSTTTTAGTSRQRRNKKEEPHMAPSRKLIHAFLPSSVRLSIDMRLRGRASVSETFSHHR